MARAAIRSLAGMTRMLYTSSMTCTDAPALPTVTLSGPAATTVAQMLHEALAHAEFSLRYAQQEAATHRMARIRERATAQILTLESRRAALAQAFQPFRAAGFDR